MARKLLLLLGLLAFAAGGVCHAAANLLTGYDFEGEPAGWTKEGWLSGDDVTRYELTDRNPHGGKAAVAIENLKENDARWMQTVKVEPSTVYKLSAWIRTENVPQDKLGANVSVIGSLAVSAGVTGTSRDWTYVELYGKTGSKQTQLGVALRLGGYASLTTGKAYFDDVNLEKIGQPPAGAKIGSFDMAAVGGGDTVDNAASPEVSPTIYVLLALVYLLFFLYVYKMWIRRERLGGKQTSFATAIAVPLIGASALFRLYLAATVHGHPADMQTFYAWARHAASVGIAHFYDGGIAVDYPPGYIYVLYLIGKAGNALGYGAESPGLWVLMKLPAIAADCAVAWLLYRVGRGRIGAGAALGVAALYMWNPVAILNSAIWGQVDALFALPLALCFLLLVKERLPAAAVLFAVALLIKPQALIFTPVLLLAAYRTRSWKKFALSVAAGLGAFVLLALPFSGGKNPVWLIDLYKSTLASYPYATLNAFNLYGLLGANWAPGGSALSLSSYQGWGTVFIVLAVAVAAYYFLRSRLEERASVIFYTGAVLIAFVFVLAAKMHERYLFPVLPLLLLAAIFSKDRRFLQLFAGFSLTQFLNVGLVFAYSQKYVYQVPAKEGWLLIVSFANLVMLAWLLTVGASLYIARRVKPIDEPLPAVDTEKLLLPKNNAPADERLTRSDWLWMAGLTLAYTAVALFHLGSLKSPETPWKPSAGESLIVDFGEAKTFERINAFGGIGDGKFRIQFSESTAGFDRDLLFDQSYTKVLTWNVMPANVTSRFAKVTVDAPGFSLMELAFYEKGSTQPTPPMEIKHTDGSPDPETGSIEQLFDEQNKAVYKPTYMNGSYFDEIYHARTAYEHLEGIVPYENTHPPLGKLLIAVGIKVFGLNPFGWRIVGTLFGAGMVPLMYLFARRLFRSSFYARIAAFLTIVEFMHFAQTRIATIDVYGVFFIIIMFYFMHRYMSRSFYDAPLRKTLVPLFWCGLFFGIGAASKWIVIYGGAGLAVLLFWTLYDRYREYAAAKSLLRGGEPPVSVLPGSQHETAQTRRETAATGEQLQEAALRIVRLFPRNAVLTLLACVVFFVVIPGIVYSASFAPIMAVPGQGFTLHNLIHYQQVMYDYHSKLKATHSFGSPWWEWPYMKKPIWYFSGQSELPAGRVSSIVSMGNPAIWWVGFIALIATLRIAVKERSKAMLVVLVAYFSQYLPWVLVPRLTFIYHYFAMVPFLILCITYIIKVIHDRRPQWKKWTYAYLGVAALLFVLFYPILSGLVVSKSYVQYVLRWFPEWYFY